MVGINNISRRVLLPLLVILFQSFPGFGQQDEYSRQKLLVFKDTVLLDSLTLIPGTLSLTKLNGSPIDSSCYTFLPDGRSIVFKNGNTCLGDTTYSILASYRTFPFQLDKKWQRKDPGLLHSDQPLITNPFVYIPSKTGSTDLFQMGTLNKEGSISRGLTFGNSQDVVVNSSMNLQLSGKLTDELDLLLSATDDNIPIQADGTTAQLQEFDKIFIQVNDKNHKIIAGDFEMKRPNSYFMNYYKKVQGLSYDYNWVANDIKFLGQRKGLFKASAAVSKGKFARNVFSGVEGNQGPYRLRGSENELFIVILSGSEAVYMDGELLKRGMENDYVIDYNTAEIIFTPQQLITKDKRIVVEFQYSDKQFARSVYGLGYDLEMKTKGRTIRYYANGYSEQDAKNKPLQQTLNTEEKQLLAAVGDSIQDAFVYSIDSVAFTNTEVLYHKKDTVVGFYIFQSIYEYSTNPDSAHYRLSFSFVGAGKGNYNQITSAANGKVFQWVIPDTLTNTPRGSYEPVLLLVSPKKKQMITAGTEIQWNKWSKMSVEGSFSVNDVNQFSSIDKKNDQGFAGKFQIETPLFTEKNDSKRSIGIVRGIKIGAGYEYVHLNFSPIERFRSVEFERDWNRSTLAQKEDQHIASGSLSWFRNKETPLLYRFSTFLEGSTYEGFRHEFRTDLRNKKQKFLTNASWLESSYGNYNGSFLRASLDASQQLGGIIFGAKGNFEENLIYFNTDSLLNTSVGFLEWEGYVAAPDTAKITWKAAYKSRTDKNILGERLTPSTHADNYSVGFGFRRSKIHRVTFLGTYRILTILDSTISIHKPDESLLGRIEYEATLWNGVLVSSTFFEVGSGLEQKKEFTFIEVPAGQGIYTWIDHNGNDVKELNEFEIAAFPDQATYLKVFTPTQEYIRTYYNQFAQSLMLRPGIKWKKEKGWKKWVSRFSDQVSFRGDRKSTEEDLFIAYNPFLQDVKEITLQTLNATFRNTLWVNQGSPIWAMDVSWNDVRNKSLLTNGFDTRGNSYYEGNVRWNVSKIWSFNSQYKDGYKSLRSDFFASKNYNYHYYEVQPKINYQPDPTFRAVLSYKYSEKLNAADLGGQRAEIQNYGAEIRYNTLQKGTFTARLNYIYILYAGANNGSISFEFLEGLNAGRNITWGLNFQRTLSNNLQVNLTYDARLPDGQKAIHTGGAQVRAFF